MTARDELPEGWQFLSDGQGNHRAYHVGHPGNALAMTAWCVSRPVAALLAWRIVDAEARGDGQ